jgi:hypothetical protein
MANTKSQQKFIATVKVLHSPILASAYLQAPTVAMVVVGTHSPFSGPVSKTSPTNAQPAPLAVTPRIQAAQAKVSKNTPMKPPLISVNHPFPTTSTRALAVKSAFI